MPPPPPPLPSPPAPPASPPEPPNPPHPPPPECVCQNDCEVCDDPECWYSSSHTFDGICDDGGIGSEFSRCSLGSDCDDCGPRCRAHPPSPPPP
eukprot:2802516-Prymnesium_polylepis.1